VRLSILIASTNRGMAISESGGIPRLFRSSAFDIRIDEIKPLEDGRVLVKAAQRPTSQSSKTWIHRIGYFDLIDGIGGRKTLDTSKIWLAGGWYPQDVNDEDYTAFEAYWQTQAETSWHFRTFHPYPVDRVLEESVLAEECSLGKYLYLYKNEADERMGVSHERAEVIDHLLDNDILYMILKFRVGFRLAWMKAQEGIGGRIELVSQWGRGLLLWYLSDIVYHEDKIRQIWERNKRRVEADMAPPMERGMFFVRTTPPPDPDQQMELYRDLNEGVEEPRKFVIGKRGGAPPTTYHVIDPTTYHVIDSFYDGDGRYHVFCEHQRLAEGPIRWKIGFFDVSYGIGSREIVDWSTYCTIAGFAHKSVDKIGMRRAWEQYKDAAMRGQLPNTTYRIPATILEATKEDFMALADEQRGAPEQAMVDAQRIMGGGVMPFAIEHAGDLNHRMNEAPTWQWAGYEYVAEKVRKVLAILRSPYGFMREFYENIAANAQYYGKNKEEHLHEVRSALLRYAEAHKALPVYNRAHALARDAAVALGEMQISAAIAALEAIEEHLDSIEEWVAFARENCDDCAPLMVEGHRDPMWGNERNLDYWGGQKKPECKCGRNEWFYADSIDGIGGRESGGFEDCLCQGSNRAVTHQYLYCMSCGSVINKHTREIVGEIPQQDPGIEEAPHFENLDEDREFLVFAEETAKCVGPKGWGIMAWECLCGNHFGDRGFIPMDKVDGIGSREAGFEEKPYVHGDIPSYFKCLECGRVISMGHDPEEPQGTIVSPRTAPWCHPSISESPEEFGSETLDRYGLPVLLCYCGRKSFSPARHTVGVGNRDIWEIGTEYISWHGFACVSCGRVMEISKPHKVIGHLS
jgi:tetratricopeptide (TPR) repeat protein